MLILELSGGDHVLILELSGEDHTCVNLRALSWRPYMC